MEPPVDLSAKGLQDARDAVIAAFRPLDPTETVFGQFDGYRDIEGIAPDSTTETFVAARLWIDTDRWRAVPFLLRTGKQMARSAQRVSLLLRAPDDGPYIDEPNDNVLSFSLSGSGAISLTMGVNKPGVGLEFADATVKLALDDVEGAEPLAPYVRLIHDVVNSDPPPIEPYSVGSWGPTAADALADPDGWLLSR